MRGADWHKNDFRGDVQEAMDRLLAAPVASELNRIHLLEIAVTLERVMDAQRRAWDESAQRERDLWLARYRKLSSEFLRHLKAGPHRPADWHLPAYDDLLADLEARFGRPRLLAAEDEEPEGTVVEVDESKGLSLANILALYDHDIRRAADVAQLLKKPGDPKADRARFIVMLRMGSNLSVSQIAAVASALFQDSAIDERLVSRLDKGTFSEN